jgi:hypothetical protein
MTFGQRILGDGSLFRNAEICWLTSIPGQPSQLCETHLPQCANTPKLIGAIRCFAEHCDRGFRDEVV